MLIWIAMFDGLELATFNTAENLLKSCGQTWALVQAGGVISGKADWFLNASQITRTRRAHQVTAYVFHQSLKMHSKNMTCSTFSKIYVPQNLYIESTLKVLRLLVSDMVVILENGHHNRPRRNLAWHYI